MIDTKTETISMSDEKLTQIKETVCSWGNKNSYSRRQLQSLLGQLYIYTNASDHHGTEC